MLSIQCTTIQDVTINPYVPTIPWTGENLLLQLLELNPFLTIVELLIAKRVSKGITEAFRAFKSPIKSNLFAAIRSEVHRRLRVDFNLKHVTMESIMQSGIIAGSFSSAVVGGLPPKEKPNDIDFYLHNLRQAARMLSALMQVCVGKSVLSYLNFHTCIFNLNLIHSLCMGETSPFLENASWEITFTLSTAQTGLSATCIPNVAQNKHTGLQNSSPANSHTSSLPVNSPHIPNSESYFSAVPLSATNKQHSTRSFQTPRTRPSRRSTCLMVLI